MKKITALLLIIVSIATVVVVQSCKTAQNTTAAKMLKFNFEKGKGYDYEMISNFDQKVMGQNMQMDMSAYYSMDVSEDDGSMKTITSTIDRFKMKMGVMGFNIDVDTDKPMPSLGTTEDGKDPMKMINTIFGAIKGQKFIMKVDAEGKVQEVKGFENMANSIVDSLGLNEEEKQEMRKKFDGQFNAKNMQGQFDRFLYIFPNKEVKVGDTWQKKSEVSGSMAGKYNSTYKVTDIEGDMVTLDEATKVESQDEKIKVKGDIKGTIVVDSKTGLVVTANQEIEMTTETNGMSMEMKGKTRIKGKARN
ncbi:MAG: DUF6263 family protein [Bacteroidota bacterium]|nr:DUF6263 family protein [Bacteroidota bacterium]